MMEERLLLGNLVVLNPLAKLVYHSRMQIERYCGAALTIKIGDLMV